MRLGLSRGGQPTESGSATDVTGRVTGISRGDHHTALGVTGEQHVGVRGRAHRGRGGVQQSGPRCLAERLAFFRP